MRALTMLMAVLALAAATPAAADVIRVPRDVATIQDAVDTAAPGDTIKVSKGAYPGTVAIHGKSDLTIKGTKKTGRLAVNTGKKP